jgi:hypothetical protein
MKKVARPPADDDDGDRRHRPVIRWIDVRPDYSTRTEPGAILTALDDLGW